MEWMAADGRGIFIIASGLINDGMMGRKQAKQNPGDLSEMEADRRSKGWPRRGCYCEQFEK